MLRQDGVAKTVSTRHDEDKENYLEEEKEMNSDKRSGDTVGFNSLNWSRSRIYSPR